MDQLDADLHQKILSNLNPRDVARAGGANKALRTASRTEFHSIVNNPHVIHVAERYKSKLRSPKVEMLDEPTLKETRQDLPVHQHLGLIDITIRFHMTHLMIDLNEVNMITI